MVIGVTFLCYFRLPHTIDHELLIRSVRSNKKLSTFIELKMRRIDHRTFTPFNSYMCLIGWLGKAMFIYFLSGKKYHPVIFHLEKKTLCNNIRTRVSSVQMIREIKMCPYFLSKLVSFHDNYHERSCENVSRFSVCGRFKCGQFMSAEKILKFGVTVWDEMKGKGNTKKGWTNNRSI